MSCTRSDRDALDHPFFLRAISTSVKHLGTPPPEDLQLAFRTNKLALAGWCRRNGLNDQARAHLHRVIQLEPDHALARSELGYRFVEEQWLANEEIVQFQEDLQQSAKAMTKWEVDLNEIGRALSGRAKDRQDAARARLAETESREKAERETAIAQTASAFVQRMLGAPDPTGEARKDALRVGFDRALKLEFHAAKGNADNAVRSGGQGDESGRGGRSGCAAFQTVY